MREIVTKAQYKAEHKIKSVRRKGVGLGKVYSKEVIEAHMRGEIVGR